MEEQLIKVSIVGTGLIGASIGKALVEYSEGRVFQSVCGEAGTEGKADAPGEAGAGGKNSANLNENDAWKKSVKNAGGNLENLNGVKNGAGNPPKNGAGDFSKDKKLSENGGETESKQSTLKSAQKTFNRTKFLVTGYDRTHENAAIALKTNAVHRIAASLQDALQSDIVIVAIPVQFIPIFLHENALYFKKGSIVMDTGSTKLKVTKAMQDLPQGVEFVGGHPIAGKEKGGPQNAEPMLFCRKKFVLTKENRLSRKGENTVLTLIRTLGAEPVFMESALHDRILAYTSHFPYLVSAALFSLVSEKSVELPEIFEFAGTGLKDTTRIASGDVLMSYGMLETNRENILNALDEFEETLSAFRKALLNGTLPEKLRKVKEERDKIWK